MTTFAPAGRIACALAVMAALGGTASADQPGAGFWLYERAATTPLERGQFYAGFTFKAGVQHQPRYEGLITLTNLGFQSLGAASFSPAFLSVEPGGEFGYVFRDGTFPAFFGSRVRAGVYGSFAQGHQTLASQRLPPAVAMFAAVSGRLLTAITLTPTASALETLEVQRESFQGGLKLESDIALGPNLSLSPSVAVFGGRTSESFVYLGVINNLLSGFDIDPIGANARLRTTEFGGHLGARLTWQFQPGWAVHLGGTAGPVWLRSHMTESDCFVPNFVRPGTPCGSSVFGFGLFPVTTATDTRTTIGFRGTATLGLVADLRFATVSLAGFGRYDSRIPGIQNPQLPASVNLAAPVPVTPARIRFQDGFAYGGSISVRIAIGN